MTVVNFAETVHQYNGHYTIFNQISEMNNKQIFIYSIISALIFAIIITIGIKFIIQNKKSKAVLTFTIGWSLAIVALVIENLTNIRI